ncbi:MAG: hypothetical protein ACTSR3_20320 [Candidatus Helarchaeota archaeon]
MASRELGPAKEIIPITPCIIYEKNSVSFPYDLELASKFAEIEYSRKKSELLNSKYIFFSKAIWPITIIQADAENYIAVDNLNYFSFSFKISSSPNKGKIGRLLRDGSPDKEKLPDILDEILSIVDENVQEEIQIKGLIDPDVLRGLAVLIKIVEDQPTTYMAKLEEVLSTDNVINISESFKNAIKKVEDNITSWIQIKELVNSITDEWIIDLNKDYSEKAKRSHANIYNLERELRDKILDYEARKSQDYYQLREWQVKQNKKIASEIIDTYPIINKFFEKFINKSKELKIVPTEDTDPEDLLSFVLNLIKDIDQNIPNLKSLLEKTKADMNNIKKEIEALALDIRNQEKKIEDKYKILIDNIKEKIPEVKKQKDKDLTGLELIKEKIEEKTIILKQKIDKILKICENEKNYFKSWTVSGPTVKMVMPINKIWFPLYVSEVETVDGYEKIIISPPSLLPNHYTTSERWVPFDFMNTSFKDLLKERLENALEINMELRSNFEFNCSKKNLFTIPEINKKMLRGFDDLFKKNLISKQHIDEIRKNWSESIIK